MAGDRMLLLCGVVAILASLQGGEAYEYSSAAPLNSSQWICPPGNTTRACTPEVMLNCDSLEGWPAVVYVLIDLAPLVVYLPLLILFNYNLAAGPGQSFLFFYQALLVAVPIDISVDYYPFGGGLWLGLFTMQSPINDFFGSQLLPANYRLSPRILPYIALQYCKLAAVLVIAITAVVLVKCVHCPCASWRHPWGKLRRSVRHFREKRAHKGTVLNGLCSIAVLTYGFVIQQSFSLLQPARCCNGALFCPDATDGKSCTFYCLGLKYFSNHHLPYIAVAILTLLLSLPLPLLLLYYPAVPALMKRITERSLPMTCHKLAPVFDVFQSAYKPKLMFFAAFPLLYRILLWLILSAMSATDEYGERHVVITFAFIIFLAIHSLVQPYKKPIHNYIETLYLVNLVIMSMISLSFINFTIVSSFGQVSIYIMAVVLVNLPLVVGAVYFLWKCKCSKQCRAVCCKKCKKHSTESAEENKAPAIEMPPTEANLDMSEVEKSIQLA